MAVRKLIIAYAGIASEGMTTDVQVSRNAAT